MLTTLFQDGEVPLLKAGLQSDFDQIQSRVASAFQITSSIKGELVFLKKIKALFLQKSAQLE